MRIIWAPYIILTLFILAVTLTAPAAEDQSLRQEFERNLQNNKLKEIGSKIRFNYATTYLSRSLSNNYQTGATYNRFKSGQDYKGDDLDATGSEQVFHSFSFGYQYKSHININYTSTYQDDFNKNIRYNVYNKDGSVYAVNTRKPGISHNNQRINVFVSNIVNNNNFWLSSNFYYELPSTKLSEAKDMQYGFGMHPRLGIYSNNMKLYHGLKALIERDIYKENEYDYLCGTAICHQSYQTMRVSVGGWISYQYSDKLSLNADIEFDWDQDGDQVHSVRKFNKNMDDIIEIGPNYYVGRNLSFAARVQKALDDPQNKKSALLLKMFISI